MAELIDEATDKLHGGVGSGNDREESKVCELCKVDNSMQAAVGWCETCDEMLCNYCYKAHCRQKMMKNHRLLSLEEMRSLKETKKVTSKCQKHQGKKLKYYCEDHKQLGCNRCLVSKHRQCSKVVCISEVNTHESNEYKALHLLLSKLEERLNSIEGKKGGHLSTTGSLHDKAIEGIKEAGEKLKEFIDTLVKEQIAKADMTKDDNIRNIDQVNDRKKEVGEELAAAKNMVDAVKGDNIQLFITMKHLQGELFVLESKLDYSEQENTIHEYEFVLNPELAHLVDTVKELGTLKDKPELNMEKATDEVVDVFELLRFLRIPIYSMSYAGQEPEAIQMSTDRDIRLLYVLMYPCFREDTNVELRIKEGRKCLSRCNSTHAKTGEDVVAVKVLGEEGDHGIILQAGHRYDVFVKLTDYSSDKRYDSFYGDNGQATVTKQGVTFSFRTIHSSKETSVEAGQIPGFRFELT